MALRFVAHINTLKLLLLNLSIYFQLSFGSSTVKQCFGLFCVGHIVIIFFSLFFFHFASTHQYRTLNIVCRSISHCYGVLAGVHFWTDSMFVIIWSTLRAYCLSLLFQCCSISFRFTIYFSKICWHLAHIAPLRALTIHFDVRIIDSNMHY